MAAYVCFWFFFLLLLKLVKNAWLGACCWCVGGRETERLPEHPPGPCDLSLLSAPTLASRLHRVCLSDRNGPEPKTLQGLIIVSDLELRRISKGLRQRIQVWAPTLSVKRLIVKKKTPPTVKQSKQPLPPANMAGRSAGI